MYLRYSPYQQALWSDWGWGWGGTVSSLYFIVVSKSKTVKRTRHVSFYTTNNIAINQEPKGIAKKTETEIKINFEKKKKEF